MMLRLRAPHARRGRAMHSLLSAVVAFSYPLLLCVLISMYGIKVPDRILFAIRCKRCCGQPSLGRLPSEGLRC